MPQYDLLSARELYDLAYNFHRTDHKDTMMEACETLLTKFPDSDEAKWAIKRFKLAAQEGDCDKCGRVIPPLAEKCNCGGQRMPAPPPPSKPQPKKLVPCRVCEKEIAAEAVSCPHCGIAKPGKSELGAAVSDGWKGIETIARIVTAILLVLIIAKCNGGR